MSWQDIIKNEEDDPLGLNEYYAKEQKRYDEANKWLDHTIQKVTEIKRIINSEEGAVGDEYLREIASLSIMAEEMVDRAFGFGGYDDYDSAYDTTFDQRMYEMSQADRTR
jgi:hypothetical protein